LIDNRNVNQSTYGFNRKTAESIREYWINKYDWKKTVQDLNTFDHYKTHIAVSSTYDIIIPSLPGFGYSDAPVRPGLNAPQIAGIMHILMQRLGHNSYVVCGGDWGSAIGTYMAQLYSNHVRGFLTTLPVPGRSWKHFVQSALGHYLNSWFILNRDEKDYLIKDYNGFAYLKFFW
jgi:pimeloyl-ACP methyl ester carboxylesterase